MVHETETFSQNVQERQNIVTEVFETPVVKEVFVNPVHTEVYAETIVQREGSQFSGSQSSQFNSGAQFQQQTFTNQAAPTRTV